MLGDIFDLMVGSFEFWKREFQELFEALEFIASTKSKILWLEGNHDFGLKTLLQKSGIEVFDGVVIKSFGEKKVYLAHGDLVNSEDFAYLRWRAATRSTRMQWALKLTPGFLMRKGIVPLAEALSAESRRRPRDDDQTIRSRYRSFAEQRWVEGFQGVFLGHCHVDDLYQDPPAQHFYCNLGGPIEAGSDPTSVAMRYALWIPELESFPKIYISEKMHL
jgi:UDP-2,3-diacylglucosamine hydrolase